MASQWDQNDQRFQQGEQGWWKYIYISIYIKNIKWFDIPTFFFLQWTFDSLISQLFPLNHSIYFLPIWTLSHASFASHGTLALRLCGNIPSSIFSEAYGRKALLVGGLMSIGTGDLIDINPAGGRGCFFEPKKDQPPQSVSGWCFGTMEFYDFPYIYNIIYIIYNIYIYIYIYIGNYHHHPNWLSHFSEEGYLFIFVSRQAGFGFFLGSWFYAFQFLWFSASLLFCFSAFPASLLFCFSAFLASRLFCFLLPLLLCFSWFSAFPASRFFCFLLSLLLCFSWFSAFLLFAFPASLLFCFSVFPASLLLYFCAFLLLLFYFFFSSVMCFCCSTSCSFASLLPVFTVSLFFMFFCFIRFCLYPKWNPIERP